MGSIDNEETPPFKRVKSSTTELGCFMKNPFLDLTDTARYATPSALYSQGKSDTTDSKGIIRRGEFVRVITQALYSLGYEKSGRVLEEESGFPLYSPMVSIFRKQVLDGNWDGAIATLHSIGLLDEDILKSASFIILEQKLFALLGKGRIMDALRTLRNEIAPLNINVGKVHALSSCIVSPTRCFLLGFNSHSNQSPNSRLGILEELQKVMPVLVMIPERRLEHLVEQALKVQREACAIHNSSDPSLSLYVDHKCGRDQIPSQTTQILLGHHDEVWNLQFSNNGKYLASSSSDKSVIIWEVHEDGGMSLKHKLIGHQKPVSMVTWSPDDCKLLSCGLEEVVRLWDVNSGKCVNSYGKDGIGLISCCWFPDGKQFLSFSIDKTICLWGVNGNELEQWKRQMTTKTTDTAVTKDGKVMVSKSTDNMILLWNIEAKSERIIQEEQTITSFSLSTDDKFLLVNLLNQEIHLWSIGHYPKLLARYKGHKHSRLLIRSCFGGSDQSFIASGSEDSQVYIWHRGTTNLIGALPGHAGAVNCVSWNPVNPHMLASGSDDHTIRIWRPTKASSLRQKNSYRWHHPPM